MTSVLTSRSAVSSVAAVGCSVVCVSHATASGGEEIGKQVAEELGFLYVDEEIVVTAAAESGLGPRDIADEEHRKSFATRVLNLLAEGGGDAWTMSTPAAAVMEGVLPADIRALIRETVVQTAGRGNVVIVAHAASFALEPGPPILRVLVTASPAIRANRIAATEGLDEADAKRMIKDSDAGRRDYLKRFYSVDRESPTDYDLVINTDQLSFDQGAALVLRAADL
jgi:cytidylate kinase